MIDVGPLRRDYSYMNAEAAGHAMRADLLAYGYTEDDIDWLGEQGWEPFSPIITGGTPEGS